MAHKLRLANFRDIFASLLENQGFIITLGLTRKPSVFTRGKQQINIKNNLRKVGFFHKCSLALLGKRKRGFWTIQLSTYQQLLATFHPKTTNQYIKWIK
jgi:hypothetical protein